MFLWASSIMGKKREREYKFGKMEVVTKECGKAIISVDLAELSMNLEMFTKVIFQMDKQMVQEYTVTQMELFIKGNGRTT